MDTSEHGVLSLCQVFGERAAPLPTASHKTDVVASVLPAPSVRGYVTYKQLAQATKLVLNKTMSGYPSAKSHCCTLICLMTNGYLEFLGIRGESDARRRGRLCGMPSSSHMETTSVARGGRDMGDAMHVPESYGEALADG